jgi:glycerophosphoryl diester phosphodiesterase
MRRTSLVVTGALVAGSLFATAASADGFAGNTADRSRIFHYVQSLFGKKPGHKPGRKLHVQLGPRPFYLVNDMDEGPLKDKLLSCSENDAKVSDFSISHRGAPLQFPEHSREAVLAGARMGAGIMECDVTFTKDRELVCRHSQCDLHTTTNILAIPELAAKCRKPFTPYDAATDTPASAECCTSDITVDEYKSLCAKMDASLPTATTPEQYLGGTPKFGADLYASCAEPLTLEENIALVKDLGIKFTPELKEPLVPMPFDGDFTQEAYAQKMIDTYKAAGVAPTDVWAQSFNLDDVLYWLKAAPEFGKHAVYLDDRVDTADGYTAAVAGMAALKQQGVAIVAPPSFALLKLDANKNIVPSDYAVAAKQAGLDIITWSLERSGPLASGGDYYYASVKDAIDNDGDEYTVIDVLARQVGVKGIFSDWPATVTYYANCMGLK